MDNSLEFLKSSYKFYQKQIEQKENEILNNIKEDNINNRPVEIVQHYINLVQNSIYKDGYKKEKEFIFRKTKILNHFKNYLIIRNYLETHFKINKYINSDDYTLGSLDIFKAFKENLIPDSTFTHVYKSSNLRNLTQFDIMKDNSVINVGKKEKISFELYQRIYMFDIYFSQIFKDLKDNDLSYYNDTENEILSQISKWGQIISELPVDISNQDMIYYELGEYLPRFTKFFYNAVVNM